MVDSHAPKDHLCMTDHIFGVGVVTNFQFEAADIGVTAQGPKMRFLDALNALKLGDLK